MRPAQWVKNGFVLAGPIFGGALTSAEGSLNAAAALLGFCFASSAVYLVNDVADRAADRVHPTKRNRPIARGEVRVPVALALAMALAAGGLVLALAAAPLAAAAVLGYLALQVAYTFGLKHQPLLDVFAIAGGFLLRVVGGTAAVSVAPSEWLLLCSGCLALLLGFGKRRHEVVSLADAAGSHRAVLEEYSVGFLDQALSLLSATTLVAYAVYAAQSPAGTAMMWTVPWVAFGLLRYAYLVHHRHQGGSPTALLLGDRQLALTVVGWGLTGALIVYFG